MQIEALARKLDKKVRELEEKREELRKVHRDWEDIFQSIGYPTIILDAQYNILSVNKATVKAVGSHSAEELIGRKCYEIFHNTSEPPATCPFTKMFSSSKLEERYMDVEALGGVFHVSCTPVFDEMGNIQKIIHIATDITERKRAEDALRISEEKFRILFENAPLGIGVSTLEGKLLAYNEVISEITGYTKEDLLNFNVINLYQNPEDRKALLKELQSNGYVRNYEVLLKRKDGIPFYANITINMITVDGKNALAIPQFYNKLTGM